MDFTREYLQNLRDIIEQKRDADAIKLMDELHTEDIAALYDELDLDEIIYLYLLIDGEKAGLVLLKLDENDRNRVLEQIPNDTIADKFLVNLESDDAAELIRDLDEEQQDEILSRVSDVEQAGDIIDLLKYEDDSAGSIMGTEVIAVNENWSMPKCIEEMRLQAEEVDEIYYVYVIDDEERLKGVLPLKKMITSPSASRIKHVMKADPISVKDNDPIEEVAEKIEKYDLVALPVVDSIGRLVGRITIDDVIDEIREQHERDYQLASGISQDIEASDKIYSQTAARLPWLLIGMVGGLTNSILLGGFDSLFAANPKMALFIPLIGGTGGNVGIQSSAIVVQGLANNSLKQTNLWNLLSKEFVVALINASIISLVVFFFNYFFLSDPLVMTSVSISLFAVVLFASIFGTFVPMMLDRLKVDPAIATGPFITITNDLIGMMIYMLVTTALASAL